MPQPPDQADDLARLSALRQTLSDQKNCDERYMYESTDIAFLLRLLDAALSHPPLPRDVAELVKRLRAEADIILERSNTMRDANPATARIWATRAELMKCGADTVEHLSSALAAADAIVKKVEVILNGPSYWTDEYALAIRELRSMIERHDARQGDRK